MLYLLKQETRSYDYYKVGYAKNIDSRYLQYDCNCAEVFRIAERPGGRFKERLLHLYLHSFPENWGFYKNEWYQCKQDDTRILQYFLNPWEMISWTIWNNRNGLLSTSSNYDLYFWRYCTNFLNEKVLGESMIDYLMYKRTLLMPSIDNDNQNAKFMSDIDVKAQTVIDKVKSYRKFDDKLHVYCQIRKALDEKGTEGVLINRLQIYYKGTDLENLYSYFGLEGCQAYNFSVTELKKVLLIDAELDILRGKIYSVFVPGQRYLLKDIKETLRVIYGDLGLTISPKASDLERFFNVKSYQATNKETGKRDGGYLIISIKS